MYMQMKNKNIVWIVGGVALAFILLNSFTTISKKKEEQKPSGGGSMPQPAPQPKPEVPNKTDERLKNVQMGDKDLKCSEGFVRVARGGVRGGIFYTCEPMGKKLPKIDI